MSGSCRVVAAVAWLAGCGSVPIHTDPDIGYAVMTLPPFPDFKGGDAGAIHPAVLEYVLASPELPLVTYFDVALSLEHATDTGLLADMGGHSERAYEDVRDLEDEVTRGAAKGHLTTGVDFARARARRLTPHINTGLSTGGGATQVICCRSPDPDLLIFPDRRELRQAVTIYILRSEKAQVLKVRVMALRHRDLTWDLSRVPGAFDPKASLDYDQVARTIVALHEEPR